MGILRPFAFGVIEPSFAWNAHIADRQTATNRRALWAPRAASAASRNHIEVAATVWTLESRADLLAVFNVCAVLAAIANDIHSSKPMANTALNPATVTTFMSA